MNILIVGKPRTRTSILCDFYSKYYGLKNFHEYFDSAAELNDRYQRSKMLRKSNVKSYLLDSQIKFLDKKVKDVFDYNNSVVKLFPRHTVCAYSNVVNNFDNLERYDYLNDTTNFECLAVPNLSDILQLNKYDKIYILERNLVESAISFCYAIKVGNFLYTDNSTLAYVQKKFSKITFDIKDRSYINFAIFEHIISQKINSCIESKYDHTKLTYDNVVDYVETKLPISSDSSYIDPKFEYKEIISNYQELEDYINTVYQTFSPKFDHIVFS